MAAAVTPTAAPGRLRRMLFPALPLARLELFRRAVYAFVVVDVLVLHTSGHYHGWADPAWYVPLELGRVLHLPPATVPLVTALRWVSVAAALVALLPAVRPGLRRTAGWLVAGSWSWYQYVAFAYGKVDHDRADFVVALALLPTVAALSATDRRRSEAAGFVLRAVQLVAVATYFLSAWAKLRFGGGFGWADSATLTRAVIRRGTWLGERLLDVPGLLHATQWGLLLAELSSPLILLVGERLRRRLVGCWYLFHALVYATITIAFWPHLVMMLAFLPLEEYRDRAVARLGHRRERRTTGRVAAAG